MDLNEYITRAEADDVAALCGVLMARAGLTEAEPTSGLPLFPSPRRSEDICFNGIIFGWDHLMALLAPMRRPDGRVEGVRLSGCAVVHVPHAYFDLCDEEAEAELFGIRPAHPCDMQAITFRCEDGRERTIAPSGGEQAA